MKQIEIVGAGFSGLTAAINLARSGYDVTVYEKQKVKGGNPQARPDPAITPINLSLLHNYIGFDISPVVTTLSKGHLRLWGKTYDLYPRDDFEAFANDVEQVETYTFKTWKEVTFGSLPHKTFSQVKLSWGIKYLPGP